MTHYYALSDRYTGDNPASPTSGLANTSEVIAFTSKAARNAWVEETQLLKARALTKTDAIRLADWTRCPENLGLCRDYERVKAARVYNGDKGGYQTYVALKYSAN